ncbi:MAG: ABC transporter permease [Methylococcaceae bacterium]|nr:ABC transporter permease [Methylococcaceae bacterium]
MFFIKLILRNLLRQKLRTGLTILGIMVAVIAFCLLTTVVNSWYAGVDAAVAKRLVTRNAISLAFSMPLSYLNRIRQVDGVQAVTYANWFGGIYINEKNFFPQFAVDAESYFDITTYYRLSAEQKKAFLLDRQGAVAGRKLAEQYGWKIGDVIPLRGTIYPGNWSFVLRGIYHGAEKSTDESTFFFHWQNLNETLKKRNDSRIDQIGVFVMDINHAERAAEISHHIDATFKNSLAETLTETEKAFQLSFVAMVEAIVVAIQVVSFVVIVIIMAVMANTMAMNVREREREYATMRALGFGGGYIGALILGESVILSLSAGVLGVWATLPLVDLIGEKLVSFFPIFLLSQATVLKAFAAALVVGVVAAVFPLASVLRHRVGDGLRSMG